MQYLKVDLLEEFLDGVLVRSMLIKPFGPYSSSWYRKAFNSNAESIDIRKIRKNTKEYLCLKSPVIANHWAMYDLDSAPKKALPPEINVEYIESFGEGVAPMAMYLSRDIAKPLEIGIFENSERHVLKVIEWFPYCHLWGVDEAAVKANKRHLESTIDGCLMLFTCFYIDAEMTLDLPGVIDKVLLSGVHENYDKNYGVSCYVNYKLNRVKQSPDFSLEMLYDHWASWDDAPDRDSIEKLLKRWRKRDVTPSRKLFVDFVQLVGGQTARRYFSEFELVGLFLTVQLIQRYRSSTGGDSEPLKSDSFYRERVHFWYDKLSEEYKDVIARRAAEKEQEESGPD